MVLIPEEEEGRRSSLSDSRLRGRLLKEGTLVVLEMPTRRRIPGDGCGSGSECGSVAWDVNLGFLRSGCRNVKSSLASALGAEYRLGRSDCCGKGPVTRSLIS